MHRPWKHLVLSTVARGLLSQQRSFVENVAKEAAAPFVSALLKGQLHGDRFDGKERNKAHLGDEAADHVADDYLVSVKGSGSEEFSNDSVNMLSGHLSVCVRRSQNKAKD
jgi:hypothetical protein